MYNDISSVQINANTIQFASNSSVFETKKSLGKLVQQLASKFEGLEMNLLLCKIEGITLRAIIKNILAIGYRVTRSVILCSLMIDLKSILIILTNFSH